MPNQISNNPAKKHNNRILIVDDETNLLDSLSFTLKRNDYLTVTCSNGRTALDLFRESIRSKHPFDLVITDILLPGLNGLELIDAIKQLSNKVPLIVISNYGNLDLIAQLDKKEIAAFINKPFSTRKLLNIMSKVINEKKSNTF